MITSDSYNIAIYHLYFMYSISLSFIYIIILQAQWQPSSMQLFKKTVKLHVYPYLYSKKLFHVKDQIHM